MKVYIEIEVQHNDGQMGVATNLHGLPDDWDQQEDPLTDEYMAALDPAVQFGIMAMNVLDLAKPIICQKLSRFASIKVASLQ